MKKVAVSQRVDLINERKELRDALDQQMNEFLADVNCLSIPVPNFSIDTHLLLWLEQIKPDAILLSGGNDLGDFPKRDFVEKYLLQEAERRMLPLLGICRGMQLMAQQAGVSMVKSCGHVGTRHSLTINGGQIVNSFHVFCLSRCPKGYHIIAKAEDGTIEAIAHNKLPWEGWMWHPEREQPFNNNDINRLTSLFQSHAK